MNIGEASRYQGCKAPPECFRKSPIPILNPLEGHEEQGSSEHRDQGIHERAFEELDVHDAGEMVHAPPDEEKHPQSPHRPEDPDRPQDTSGMKPLHASCPHQQQMNRRKWNGSHEIDPVALPIPPLRLGQAALKKEIQEKEETADGVGDPEGPEGGPGEGGLQNGHHVVCVSGPRFDDLDLHKDAILQGGADQCLRAVGGRGKTQIQLGIALASVKDVDALDNALLYPGRDLGPGPGGPDVVDLDSKKGENTENEAENNPIFQGDPKIAA